MANVQVLKAAHHIKKGVETVGDQVAEVDHKVKDVSDKVNLVIEGTFSALATHKLRHSKPIYD